MSYRYRFVDGFIAMRCDGDSEGFLFYNLILCPVTISLGETHVPIPNTLVKP